jgi:membrane protein DedA with SNARE-associated domain
LVAEKTDVYLITVGFFVSGGMTLFEKLATSRRVFSFVSNLLITQVSKFTYTFISTSIEVGHLLSIEVGHLKVRSSKNHALDSLSPQRAKCYNESMFGEASIEQIIILAGYFGIFGLMITNGLFSFPSSQILYIVSGYFIFSGSLNFFLVSIAGAIGNTIGNTILFYLTREKGLEYITKLTLLPLEEIKKVQIAFSKKGPWFVLFGKLLPAIKVFVPIVAGIGKMKTSIFIPIILVSSYIWSVLFIALGYYFGKSTDFFGKYAIVLGVIALILVGVFFKYMNSSSILQELKNKQ